VTNRVYVGAKQSTNGLTQAQVQVDITRKLKVQTTLSTGGGTVQGATPENDPGSSVGVSYQFQY
jgi:translocation and assembly module TamB